MTNKHELIAKVLELLAHEELPDSLEIGTPSKSGALKIYLDFEKPEECKKKIDNAFEIRTYANTKMMQ